MNNKLEWEDIFSKNNHYISFSTARAKVIGGWLITHSIMIDKKISTGTCFIPDENHEWELKDLIK